MPHMYKGVGRAVSPEAPMYVWDTQCTTYLNGLDEHAVVMPRLSVHGATGRDLGLCHLLLPDCQWIIITK